MVCKLELFLLGDDYLQQMWAFISPELLKAIEEEPEEEVTPEMMDSFAKVSENTPLFLLFPIHVHTLTFDEGLGPKPQSYLYSVVLEFFLCYSMFLQALKFVLHRFM